jgi:Pyridoxamine 5'-phosphate oxidase
MFATLGNLLEDGRCALLFPALGEGRSLQVTGRARIESHTPVDEDLDTGRSIRVAVEHVIEE